MMRCQSAASWLPIRCFTRAHAQRRYHHATDGSSVPFSVGAAVFLYATARLFCHLSLFRITYIAFLCVALRPLLLKYFSHHIHSLTDIVAKFVRAVTPAPAAAAASVPSVQAPAAAAAGKKEM
jgi:hypothetical protein